MMRQACSKFAPLLDVPLGDKSSSKWFLGPWGRDDYMKQLQDFKRSKAFAPIESNWEKSCAQHLLRMYEQCATFAPHVRAMRFDLGHQQVKGPEEF